MSHLLRLFLRARQTQIRRDSSLVKEKEEEENGLLNAGVCTLYCTHVIVILYTCSLLM